MKTIYLLIFIVFSVFLVSCEHNDRTNQKIFATNFDMKIVAVNYDGNTSTDDKFHTPQAVSIILLETVKEPKLYVEINTSKIYHEFGSNIHIDKVWMYNHKVGDTVHFDYLRKEHFFELKERK